MEKKEIRNENNESYIAEIVSQEIAKRIVTTNNGYYENREAKYGIREGVTRQLSNTSIQRKMKSLRELLKEHRLRL